MASFKRIEQKKWHDLTDLLTTPSVMLHPEQTIVPIVIVDEFNEPTEFLGTGSFVGNPPVLITADHVVKNCTGRLAISLPSGQYPANVIVHRPKSDLALLDVSGYVCKNPLVLAGNDELTTVKQVVCLEYSTTRPEQAGLHFNPATRLGNVTRLINETDRYKEAGDEALELSFPAISGASGAPIICLEDYHLWGIVMANVSYQLLPVQIETTLDEKNQLLQEVQYYLPQGIAIHVKHLRAFLNEVKNN